MSVWDGNVEVSSDTGEGSGFRLLGPVDLDHHGLNRLKIEKGISHTC
jgi:hypothetical protein